MNECGYFDPLFDTHRFHYKSLYKTGYKQHRLEKKNLQTKMHFGMFFLHSESEISKLEDGKKLMKKNEKQQIEYCFISLHFGCLRHWLNDLRVDNSLKSRHERISQRMTTHILKRKLVLWISFHIWIFYLNFCLWGKAEERFGRWGSLKKNNFRLSWKWEQF